MGRYIDWRVMNLGADFKEIAGRLGVDQVMARVIVNRGQDTPEKQRKYVRGTLEDIPEPELMLNCREAAELLKEKLQAKKKIRIMADYDVDGVTSCYVLLDALQALGADVSYDIPDRLTDGYGMSVRMVEEAFRDGVDTLLTCDNGISAYESISKAKSYGMTVIVTDHHQILGDLPEADLIVNPWQKDCPYPYKEICGVEVAYKVIRVLAGLMDSPLPPEKYLEFVALGACCDVMPIMEENRIIIREGLRIMAHTENVGLRALLTVNGLQGKPLTTYHLGFILGPSINSEGRLASAKEAMELLLMTDREKAEAKAEEIKALNQTRKAATIDGTEFAFGYLDETGKGESDHVIVLLIPELHESLAGIVAGKIKNRYYRPTIIFARSETEPGLLKGSGRSIEGYNMVEKLGEAKDLLNGFGGHRMAAGMSIREENLEAFARRLNELDGLTENDLTEKVYIDVPMPLSYVSDNLAEQIEAMEPFGTGNPRPLFADRRLRLVGIRQLGRSGKYFRLTFQDERAFRSEVITFDGEPLFQDIKMWLELEDCDRIMRGHELDRVPKMDIIYTLSINEYNGNREAQCKMEYYRRSPED